MPATDKKKIKHLPLHEIYFKNRWIHLDEPIILEVQYEMDEYILSNEEFHLLATASSLEQGIQEINEELVALRAEYVDVDLNTLTLDAIEFRAKLRYRKFPA